MPGNFLIEEYVLGLIVESILNDVKNKDPLHFACLSVLGTGSYYEGTDNKQWSDFDLMLVVEELTITESTTFISWCERIPIPPNMAVLPGLWSQINVEPP